jgi:anti-anti-sigma factor
MGALLSIRHLREDDRDILIVAGEIDLATAPELIAAAITLISQQARGIVVDIDGVSFMDSSGLLAISTIHKACEARGCDFALEGPRPQPQRLLEVSGLELLAGERSRSRAPAAAEGNIVASVGGQSGRRGAVS